MSSNKSLTCNYLRAQTLRVSCPKGRQYQGLRSSRNKVHIPKMHGLQHQGKDRDGWGYFIPRELKYIARDHLREDDYIYTRSLCIQERSKEESLTQGFQVSQGPKERNSRNKDEVASSQEVLSRVVRKHPREECYTSNLCVYKAKSRGVANPQPFPIKPSPQREKLKRLVTLKTLEM